MTPYYNNDGITIYHGDCREVLPSITGDLILTDPPYSHRHMVGGGLASASQFYRERKLDGLNAFVLADFSDLIIAAAPMLIAFHSRDLIHDYAILAKRTGRRYDLHFWHKPNAIPFTANTWKSDIEYLALIWEKVPGWHQCAQHVHSKVFIAPINTDNAHPAAKPIPLLTKYILVLDAQDIIDPFMGSGTTLVAAKNLGRRAIGIEIDERYCEIAAERLAQTVFNFERR